MAAPPPAHESVEPSQPVTTPVAEQTPTPPPTSEPEITPGPALASEPAPPEPEQIPFGSPVPGKPGFVTSPYSPGAGYIDVTGFAPGSKARDPYTNKIFRVP